MPYCLLLPQLSVIVPMLTTILGSQAKRLLTFLLQTIYLLLFCLSQVNGVSAWITKKVTFALQFHFVKDRICANKSIIVLNDV